MSTWRNKPADKQNYPKRRSFEQGNAEIDAAHVTTQRLYCDALRFWRRCCGEATMCLIRGMIFVPRSRRLVAQKQVIAGGRRRIPPATHVEWFVRRADFHSVVSWELG